MESGQLGSGEVTNKEREAEMKQEKEEQEKKIGLLTYLGQVGISGMGIGDINGVGISVHWWY